MEQGAPATISVVVVEPAIRRHQQRERILAGVAEGRVAGSWVSATASVSSWFRPGVPAMVRATCATSIGCVTPRVEDDALSDLPRHFRGAPSRVVVRVSGLSDPVSDVG